MAFKCVKGFDQSIPMHCATSSTIVQGELCVFDVSAGAAVFKVIKATASLLGCNVAGVAVNTPASGDTVVNIIPIVPGQVWEYDCTSNSLSTMLGKLNDLTDGLTVANSATNSTAATAFVRNLEAVGAAADKKMRGLIIGAQSPKALS
jgi:hypothetical protein